MTEAEYSAWHEDAAQAISDLLRDEMVRRGPGGFFGGWYERAIHAAMFAVPSILTTILERIGKLTVDDLASLAAHRGTERG